MLLAGTGVSSSFPAIDTACRYLRSGQMDLALVLALNGNSPPELAALLKADQLAEGTFLLALARRTHAKRGAGRSSSRCDLLVEAYRASVTQHTTATWMRTVWSSAWLALRPPSTTTASGSDSASQKAGWPQLTDTKRCGRVPSSSPPEALAISPPGAWRNAPGRHRPITNAQRAEAWRPRRSLPLAAVR